jgi:hypothetical protein
MRRFAWTLAFACLTTACAGPRPVGPPVDSTVAVADRTDSIDRGLLLGRWQCAQANAPAGIEAPGYTLEYDIDGNGRSRSVTAGGPAGTPLAEARLAIDTHWRWGTLGDRVEQSGMVSTVQPADAAPISLVAARAAQVSLDALAEEAPPVSRIEVLQLDAERLIIRPEGRPQIVACDRLR